MEDMTMLHPDGLGDREEARAAGRTRSCVARSGAAGMRAAAAGAGIAAAAPVRSGHADGRSAAAGAGAPVHSGHASGREVPRGQETPHERLTHRDFARFARQTVEEIARDCQVQAFRATGPGGQGMNTTDSAVRMVHEPTGIVVVSRESRSQFQNRASCLRKLRAEFARRATPPKKRVATKPSKAAKARRLANKRHRSQVKELRRNPRLDD